MSQIEWFTQQHDFKNLDMDDIYLLLNTAHEEFNEQMIEKIIEQNRDTVADMLKKDRQHLIPHVGTSLLSPTIWEFAQEIGVVRKDMTHFCLFAVEQQLDKGLKASASQFIAQWLRNHVLDTAPVEAASYFYFWAVRCEAKDLARALEQHPIFPQLNIPHALKFCATHKKNKRLTYACNDFIGALNASLNRTDGAACFLKVFENIPHYTNSFETIELLTKNLFSSLLRTNIFSPKRGMFFREIFNSPKFTSAFEQFLIAGFAFNAYKFSENDQGVFCPHPNTHTAHSISDLVALQGTHRQLIDLSRIDFESVNRTMGNPHLAAQICHQMTKSPIVTDREYRQFFKKITTQPNDKNYNTFAHYFVQQQLNRTYSVNARDVLKRVYTIFPEQRNIKNSKNNSPLDLLRHKVSADILEEYESQYLSKQLTKTVSTSNPNNVARRKM